MQIHEILQKQREFFATGATLDVSFRIAMLKKLRAALDAKEADILAALQQDLGKSDFEGFMCEVGLVRSELTFMLRKTKKLSKEKRVSTPMTQFPSRSFIKPCFFT